MDKGNDNTHEKKWLSNFVRNLWYFSIFYFWLVPLPHNIAYNPNRSVFGFQEIHHVEKKQK